MNLYDVEIDTEQITPESFPMETETVYYDLNDYKKAVYSATKQAIIDAHNEIKEEEEKEDLKKDSSRSVEPSPTPSIVYVSNMPEGIDINNFNDIDFSSINDTIADYSSDNPSVEFSSSTDAHLYTVSTPDPVGSATGQGAVYLLEIRNIILIFCLLWFVVYIVSMLKRTTKRFTKGDN